MKLIYKGVIITAQTLFQSPQMSKRRFLYAMQCMYRGHEACSVVSDCILDKLSEVNQK